MECRRKKAASFYVYVQQRELAGHSRTIGLDSMNAMNYYNLNNSPGSFKAIVCIQYNTIRKGTAVQCGESACPSHLFPPDAGSAGLIFDVYYLLYLLFIKALQSNAVHVMSLQCPLHGLYRSVNPH